MQAIITKYLPATNTKPSRISAKCARGSIIVSYPHELSGDACHVYAVDQLVARFAAEDLTQYGTPLAANPWSKARVFGTLPSGDVVHVFVEAKK